VLNTFLMNYCGIKKDLILFVADASPHKQGKYLPGSHIPLVNEDAIRETQPDVVLILPWNIRDEIMSQLSYIRKWNGKFAVPELQIIWLGIYLSMKRSKKRLRW